MDTWDFLRWHHCPEAPVQKFKTPVDNFHDLLGGYTWLYYVILYTSIYLLKYDPFILMWMIIIHWEFAGNLDDLAHPGARVGRSGVSGSRWSYATRNTTKP